MQRSVKYAALKVPRRNGETEVSIKAGDAAEWRFAGEPQLETTRLFPNDSRKPLIVEMTQPKRVLFATNYTNYTNRRVFIQKLLSNQFLLSDQSVVEESGRTVSERYLWKFSYS